MQLIQMIIKIIIYILLLRIWLQLARADFYNPVSQLIVKITQPLTSGLRQILPLCRRFDLASFIVIIILLCLPLLINLFQPQMVAQLLHLAVIKALILSLITTILSATCNLLYWVIIIRAILSWIGQYQHPFNILLYQITEPLLAPIRRLLPSTGMLDFSPMILLLIIIALQYFIL